MYYLAKFCRICIQTGVKLVDIESVDIDSIKLSKKLEDCMKMVIHRESLSTNICIQCVKKLRVSYEFHNMCKRSSNILQGFLSELLSNTDKISNDNFQNSEVRVSVSPLENNGPSQPIRKRITKAERCSILKALLSTQGSRILKNSLLNGNDNYRGGLKSIIDFTTTFDFGYNLDNNDCCKTTPLEKLKKFSDNFFKQDFSAFRDTILFIIENNNNEILCDSDDDDSMFEDCIQNSFNGIKFEEVIIEPDIKIKSEMMEETENNNEEYPSEFVETLFLDQKELVDVKEEYSSEPETASEYEYNNFEKNNFVQMSTSMEMLSDLVGSFSDRSDCPRKTFSCSSIRCRTRGNPYISPQLRNQFMLRSFQCKKCPRYFKTPGYLKAHMAKVHNPFNS